METMNGEKICRELEAALRGIAGQWTEASQNQAQAAVQLAVKQEETNSLHRQANEIAEKTLEILMGHNEKMTSGMNFLLENCRECRAQSGPLGGLLAKLNGNGNSHKKKNGDSLAWWEKVWLPLLLAVVSALSILAGTWIQSFRDAEARTVQIKERK